MKLGFVFPGQGAQSVGMGKDLYEKYDEIKEIYKFAEKISGVDVKKLSFDSTEEELSQTKNTQISILTMSLGILEILKQNNIQAEYSTGLSLGEYTALIYSNILNKEDGLKLVKKRGEYMQNYVPEGNWAMAAVLGLENSAVEEACKKIEKGFIVPANYNCPGQVAVSGDKEAITEMIERAKEFGAKRVLELKTSGPFHTEKLEKASKLIREELENITFNQSEKIVIKNIDAKPYEKDSDIKDILAKHVMSPVRFSESVEYMLNQGVDTIVEIGPGKVLTGFVKKINKEIKTYNINDVQSLEAFIAEFKN